jgi:hypothetical protein
MGKGGKSIKYAKANYEDALKGYDSAYDELEAAKAAVAKDNSKANQDRLATAGQNFDMAEDKFKKEAKKYENTARAVSEGSFKNAQAGAMSALSTVLDSLPGADIAKNLWGQHKEAQDQVDNKTESNKDRADDLKQFAKEIKDKIGEKTPMGMIHTKLSNDQLMREIMEITQTKMKSAADEKRKLLKKFREDLEANKGNVSYSMSLMARANKAYLTDEHGKLLTDEALESQLQVYEKIPMQIEALKNSGVTNAGQLMKQLEQIIGSEAKASNKPMYKDLEKLVQDIKGSLGK